MIQLLDVSPTQQGLSRDYAAGWRIAWWEAAQARPAEARPSLVAVELDGGDAAALERALASARKDPSVIALVGTAGDALASSTAERARHGLGLAHLAPWLDDARHDDEASTVCLFASRETQLRRALAALDGMGLTSLQVVYAQREQQAAGRAEVDALARRLGVAITVLAPNPAEDMQALGRRAAALPAGARVFVGPALELALLTRGLAERGDRRFTVGLAAIDAATLREVGPDARVPLLLAQVVPDAQRAKDAAATAYRAGLAKLFDEAPSAAGLAGFLAGRYALHLIGAAGAGGATRESLLAQARRRAPFDGGGAARFAFGDGRRGSEFVELSFVGAKG